MPSTVGYFSRRPSSRDRSRGQSTEKRGKAAAFLGARPSTESLQRIPIIGNQRFLLEFGPTMAVGRKRFIFESCTDRIYALVTRGPGRMRGRFAPPDLTKYLTT
jgi:hypothetical protein